MKDVLVDLAAESRLWSKIPRLFPPGLRGGLLGSRIDNARTCSHALKTKLDHQIKGTNTP